jgi:hypothetical protein
MLIIALVMLAVMFLIAGVFKDYIYEKHSIFSLAPGTETVQLTDSEEYLKNNVYVECKKSDNYEYTIVVNDVGFSYTSKTKAHPVFVFKGLTAASEPLIVELPGRFTLTGKVQSAQSPLQKETILLGFFKNDEECLSIASSSDVNRLERFVDKCPKAMEAETSFVASVAGC